MLTRERMRELIEQHGLSDRADEIMADARPSIHLTLRYDVDEADIPIGASKMGGSPDVPADFEWPTWNDQYLSFIAQIRLADAKPFDLENLLPETGMLYFFYEVNQYFTLPYEEMFKKSGPYKVIYAADKNLTRRQHAISKYQYSSSTILETEVYKACPIVFELEWTPLSASQPGSKQQPLLPPPSAEHDRYWGADSWWSAVEDELARPRHRLLGVETDIQYNYSLMDDASKAWNFGTAEDWMLLLQIDSDRWPQTKPGFQWGDLGLIYFCINKEDLRSQNFDRIWLDLICY